MRRALLLILGLTASCATNRAALPPDPLESAQCEAWTLEYGSHPFKDSWVRDGREFKSQEIFPVLRARKPSRRAFNQASALNMSSAVMLGAGVGLLASAPIFAVEPEPMPEFALSLAITGPIMIAGGILLMVVTNRSLHRTAEIYNSDICADGR